MIKNCSVRIVGERPVKLMQTILDEIGEIDRFDHVKKLIAFAGIDPSFFLPESLQLPKIQSLNAVLEGSNSLIPNCSVWTAKLT